MRVTAGKHNSSSINFAHLSGTVMVIHFENRRLRVTLLSLDGGGASTAASCLHQTPCKDIFVALPVKSFYSEHTVISARLQGPQLHDTSTLAFFAGSHISLRSRMYLSLCALCLFILAIHTGKF